MKRRSKTIAVALGSVLITGCAVILYLNLSSGEPNIDPIVKDVGDVRSVQFQRAMGTLLGPPLLPGNRVVELLNGDQIFPAMLEAIRGARRSITFETYIYWSGLVGEQFAVALGERARSGVHVHLLIDWAGSGKMDRSLIARMERDGVQIARYHPLAWYNLSRLNNRTHRKLLVVDGRIGFTGGVGIADKWLGDADGSDHWRDSHFRIEGPAVGQLQAVFMDNWLKTHAEVLLGEDYFPAIECAGPSLAQVFKSSVHQGSESVRLMYLMAITAARRSILISNSYFVPDEVTVQALVGARRRGVAVKIIVPGPITDVTITNRASHALWGPMLEAGVEIYEYQPTMYHCKVMVVDDYWTSVGSTNFDIRSFRLNDEANLNVFDPEFAARQAQVFLADVRQSQRITLESWQNRPISTKLMERLASLLKKQL